ncbi:hypothetical protein LRS10_00700 [Phenylobacterium sp. J426]|uniref:hypothetical protein n=1 Tax=Phenylobacterium sp. J426 TaxID=2898439 RepID=UPI002150706F|nr:hypothetical protein [Phenylobacterium sp. J426]MCR5872838.1 hypothetical protein [Phenylobacterium sp. J426]
MNVESSGFPQIYLLNHATNWALKTSFDESAQPYAPQSIGVPMTLLDRIPTLSDEEVVNLLTNARRLSEQGDEKQQAAAAELLPALEDEAEKRRQARMERTKAKRAAARKPRKVAA